jgi:hypothetical protein
MSVDTGSPMPAGSGSGSSFRIHPNSTGSPDRTGCKSEPLLGNQHNKIL